MLRFKDSEGCLFEASGDMLKQYSNAKGALRLTGQIQRYAWGKVGQASRIAHFVDASLAQGPLAEFWLGAHPKGSAHVVLDDNKEVPLGSVLAEGNDLPFMLKVLSINPEHGLSIQSHPDAALARSLHARDPEHYPDDSHKPEIGVALTPVSLLYGFKPLNDIAVTVSQFPELKELLGKELSHALDSFGGEHDPSLLKKIFSSLLLAPSADVARAVTQILNRLGSHTVVPVEVALIRRLATNHGTGDVGLVALCIMNVVSVAPGQGIFVEPNTPHAYLDGDLVECMACSDNVIRAGLTPKFKDIATLIETSRYLVVGAPGLIAAQQDATGRAFFTTPASEFSLGVVKPEVGVASFDASKGSGVVLCIGQSATIVHKESAERITLQDGGAALLPRGSGSYALSCVGADLFVAEAGVRG